MTLKELYYTIRPLAALRAGEPFRVHPVIYLMVAAVVSVIGGVASGLGICILIGLELDRSGVPLIYLFGSCTMSLLALVLCLFWKNRAVFYGLNTFTFLTVLLSILAVVHSVF